MKPTTFSAIKNDQQNLKWKSIFDLHWPAYKQWYEAKKGGSINNDALLQATHELNDYMPEIMPIYRQLCELVNDDPVACQFLTLHQPPAYLINCSQAVFFGDEPMLIRNYDLSPDLSENTIFHSNWLNRKVISTNECLWGADDGINDAGLAISLTFGGSKELGQGFGIPIILRYVLQTCETVKQAVEQLKRIPSHMAYNVTVLDRSGDFSTVMLAPNQQTIVTQERTTTNHQQKIVWPEQASFSKTSQRKSHLDKLLDQSDLTEKNLINEFHRSPLYSTNYQQSFGTVYTAVYKPLSKKMSYHWPNEKWTHSIDSFNEGEKAIQLGSAAISDQTQWNYAEAEANEDLSEQIKNQFDSIFTYIPESLITNKPAYKHLQNKLNSDQSINWDQFATSMQEIWKEDSKSA